MWIQASCSGSTLSHPHDASILLVKLTLCILEIPKGVLWQIVKTQTKCRKHGKKSGPALFAKINAGVHNYLEIYTCDPLNLSWTILPLLYIFICLGKFIRIKKIKPLERLKIRPQGYKTFFMLNSTLHEIYPAHKC